MADTDPTGGYEGFAIIEQYGHRRLAGYIRPVEQYGAKMARLDIPAVDDQPARTLYLGGTSIYALHPCDETIARAAAATMPEPPIARWELARALPAAATIDPNDMDDDDYYDPDEDEVYTRPVAATAPQAAPSGLPCGHRSGIHDEHCDAINEPAPVDEGAALIEATEAEIRDELGGDDPASVEQLIEQRDAWAATARMLAAALDGRPSAPDTGSSREDPTFNPAYQVARCGQLSTHSRHVVEHGPDQPRNCPGVPADTGSTP